MIFSLRKDPQTLDLITEVNLRICRLSPNGDLQVAAGAGPLMAVVQAIGVDPYMRVTQAARVSPSSMVAALVTNTPFEARVGLIRGCCHSLFYFFFPFCLIHSLTSVY